LDNDSTIRRHFYHEQFTNLAWQAAAVAGVTVSDRAKPQFINFYGLNGTIPHVSYYRVLEPGAVPDEAISNKVVFVGMAPIINYQGSKSSDEFRTPYTRWTGVSSPGVEIQATASLNLIRGDWMSRLPPVAEAGMILIGAFLLCFLLPASRPEIAFGGGMAASVAVAAAAIFVAQQLHWWFSWAVISVVEVPAALGWFAVSILRRRIRETTLDEMFDKELDEPLGVGPPRIPEHQMIRLFAEGSYGQVWLARSAIGNYRAVKIVTRSAFGDNGPFETEFRGIKTFEPISRSHEGFVNILQAGRREKAGYFYYVMELADDLVMGQQIDPDKYVPRTLDGDLKKRGTIPCHECFEMGTLLAGALQKLHDSGLVHRDIKPSNIIFVRGIPKLADIGLVIAAADAKSFVGTKGFVAPEGAGSPQADIYSLGKVLYEMGMGKDRTEFPALPNTLAEDPQREQLLALNEVVVKACRPNPIRRYSSAAKMQADLKRFGKRFKVA
jgi:hypothetical protein